MKILSLFDGMANGYITFKELGIPIDRYVAYEIDKYAIQVAKHNFPDIEEMGDVFTADFSQFKGFDFIVGGSPCTYWSIAQKNNRETVASGMGWELFSQYVRALNEVKPKYFVYENNKSMSNEIRQCITETFGFAPVCIDSALVSAQNRQRLYWAGSFNPDGTYSRVKVEQPKDRGILLKDILECGTAWQDKSFCATSTYYKGNTLERTLTKKTRTMVAEPLNTTNGGKSQTIKAQYEKTGPSNILGYHSTYGASGVAEPLIVKEATSKGYTEIQPLECVDMTEPNSKTRRGRKMVEKSNCLTTQPQYYQYCAMVWEWDEQGNPIKAKSFADGKLHDVYKVANGEIAIKRKKYPIKLIDGYYIIRKLTIKECMRLQTVPEWYDFSVISNSQAYKCIGNGWTVEVIKHLVAACLNGELEPMQLSLF